MDSEYLKSTVGPAMTSAMASLVVEQPNDAVEVRNSVPTDRVVKRPLQWPIDPKHSLPRPF